MERTTGRITGVKNAEHIGTLSELENVQKSMLEQPTKWIFNTKLNWKENGFVLKNDVIYIPASKNGKASNGEVIAGVGDYVLNLNDGRKTIIFTPELKERVARGDFSWFTK